MKRHHTNIDYYMGENGIKNVSDFAELLGVKQQNLSYRLNGEISTSTLEICSAYFNVPVCLLIRSDYIAVKK